MPGKSYQYLANYDAETTAWSAAAGPGGASPYTPPVDGRLTGIRLMKGRTAATTLMNQINIRLTCALWSPNSMVVGLCGAGLETAPAYQTAPVDFDVDQPVKAGVPITIEGINILSNAVTADVHIFGRIE